MEGICCWWCCHAFDGEPLQMPYSYDNLRNKFVTEGHFCSWSCVKSYALDKYGINRGSIICGNIIIMRKKMYNIVGPVVIAPKRHRLKMFGGDLSIDDFRANRTIDRIKPLEIKTETAVERLIPMVSGTRKMSQINNASGTNDTLKLKRNKPLLREQNDLGAALGLIIKDKV